MEKENLKQKGGTKGITLVALVVTIVVLLILAGITITMLFSDNGIITKAREAADSVDKAQGDTLNGLNDLVDDMGVALGTNAPKIEKQGELVPTSTKYAKYTDSTSSDVVPIPGGYGVVGKSSSGEENTIASGLVISDLAGDTLDNEPNSSGKRGNQFVWVPVNDEQLSSMYGTDSNNKKHGKLYGFTSTGKVALNWTETDGVMNITSTTGYREPDIVTYYDGSDATDASYFKAAISETMTEAQFKEQLEKEFDSMIKSAEQYKGFYIGRYETSGLSENNKTTKPTVQKGGTVGNATWYYQYQEIKNMSNTITTASMIWGCQFDRTLEWIAQTNLKDGQPDYSLVASSRTWGNHNGMQRTSGYSPAWQKNHVYDLAGNALDWTIEANSTGCRVQRRRLL